MSYKRKYKKGEHILTLDEMAAQEFIYCRHQVLHKGWFMSWQFRMAAKLVGPNGVIYYALPNEV